MRNTQIQNTNVFVFKYKYKYQVVPNTLHLQRYLRPAAADVPELTNANQWPFIRAAFSHWASRFPTTGLVLFPPPPQFHKNPHPPTVWDEDATNRKIIFSMVKLVVFQPSCCAIPVSESNVAETWLSMDWVIANKLLPYIYIEWFGVSWGK